MDQLGRHFSFFLVFLFLFYLFWVSAKQLNLLYGDENASLMSNRNDELNRQMGRLEANMYNIHEGAARDFMQQEKNFKMSVNNYKVGNIAQERAPIYRYELKTPEEKKIAQYYRDFRNGKVDI